ncbi:ATP-binding protein [Streptomyces litchfieldiae]|uniref:Nuclease SbcCD subunit C n=1 Tax=Streptomyces litchfieldiae TaxID=3075543 RepID=A0ABU2MPH0_9ACTN|nr:AAA family ATPase [Streptomyces sp. DSM 44938]MDT0343511.1 AAA family ATPase [Streptomyces sp. DSM 44938]
MSDDPITPVLALRDVLLKRLEESGLAADVRELLRDLLPEAAAAGRAQAGPMYLRSLTAAGWRGIGREVTLDLPFGPGLTVVTGPNGTGKSSFAEAVEIALTGRNYRWDAGRTKTQVWKKGWRNLHAAQTPEISVRLTLDDRGAPVTVRRVWHGESVDDATTVVERPGAPDRALEDVVDAEALALYRPFLPYSELGAMVDGTLSSLHDALARFLGLGPLSDMDEQLLARNKPLTDAGKRLTALTKTVLAELSGHDDPRAVAAAAVLRSRKPDLALVRGLLEADAGAAADETARLRGLASLAGPDPDEVAGAVERLRAATARAEAVRDGTAEDARRLAALLEQGLEHRRHADSADCPLCGSAGRLDHAWAERARAEVARLQAVAAEAEGARMALDAARRAVHDLVQPVPALLQRESSSLASLWRDWALCRGLNEPGALADRVAQLAAALDEASRRAREDAARRLADRDERWQPVAVRLAEWVGAAEAAAEADPLSRRIKAARAWLRTVTDELRDERLRPFVQESQTVWKRLCQRSSVSLGSVTLAGTAKHGRVELGVAVDAVDAPAYSVLSQGELHSLALSLFIPRATHSGSPFGFLLIDDPVQSMDPDKVEGLAHVLEECARHRQVVVFTHDTRLQHAIAHLGIEATVLRISRGTDSAVTVETVTDPVGQALKEARELSLDEHLPVEVADHVLPTMCRVALEAACLETARRRLRDDYHLALGQIEEAVRPLERTKPLVALALLGDANAPARARVEQLCPGGWGLIEEFNSGAHGSLPSVADRKRLVRRTETLATAIRRGAGSVPEGGAR